MKRGEVERGAVEIGGERRSRYGWMKRGGVKSGVVEMRLVKISGVRWREEDEERCSGDRWCGDEELIDSGI